MKKILSFTILIGFILTTVSPVFALIATSEEKMAMPIFPKPTSQIEYPVGEDFSKLKLLIESNFTKSDEKYRYNCIMDNMLCPNYKYTSVIEKAIKLIILKTYTENVEFYNTLFGNAQSYGAITNKNTIKNILDKVPHGSTISDWQSLGFGNSIGGELLDASFGVDFTENMNSSTMLGAIEQKIKDMKRNKCYSDMDRSITNSTNDCYSNDLSNKYLPTQEELYAETVYLNRVSVKIESLKDEIEYKVETESKKTNPTPTYGNKDGYVLSIFSDFQCPACINFNKTLLPVFKKYADKGVFQIEYRQFPLTNLHKNAYKDALAVLCANEQSSYEEYSNYLYSLEESKQGGAISDDEIMQGARNLGLHIEKFSSCLNSSKFSSVIANDISMGDKLGVLGVPTIFLDKRKLDLSNFYTVESLSQYLDTLPIASQNSQDEGNNYTSLIPVSYSLRYKKDSYTLEEAQIELQKKDNSNEEFLVKSDSQAGEIPCKKYTTYLVRSQCVAATANLKEIQTALMAYNMDNVSYPETVDKLKGVYIMQFPQGFTDNFSYKLTKNSRGEADYEIRYIGHIGENTTGSGDVTITKDYKAMMGGAIIPEIPTIFSHIPSDSMVLYIRNPANLIELLNQKSNTSQRLSGIDASESIKELMKTFFELEKFDQIEKNLKHDMAIVVNNLDATAPDIIIILSESDREALSPTGKARVVGSKNGFIFIASSKESLEKLTNLTVEKSMMNAPDFQYVWWKKSTLVKDALIFVGDEFFAKMLTLETYLTHYRKYRDYSRLTSLQELAWAYTDAFGKMPTGFTELSGLGLSTLTGEVLGEYSIVDGVVTHRNIGTLNSVKTLPETRYDLSKISRTEFEDYKYNVLQYRDIWRASLDPMGIVINRYADGMEVDFFMTPIPSSPDRDLQEIQKIFEGVTKDSLSFAQNPQIRMGLLSFVLGFDPQKLQSKIKSNQEIGRGFEEFSKEVLDGKNIFDYLGGEFAWSIGSLDPDIFEGWNVEKVDAYISVQVSNEAKGKELIEMLKKKFIGEMSRGGSNTENSIYSMLAKPLIEDYKGKKIYYVESIPVPWVGKIGLAYTFVDDFFIIGLNRSTIRNTIDTAASGDIYKKNLVNVETFEKGTFFAMLFDGVNSSNELKKLYQKNQTTIPRFFGSMVQSESNITPLISSYYATEDRSRRLGKKPVLFQYELGLLSLSGTGDTMTVKMDSNKLASLSGATLEMWESIRKDPAFPASIITEKGVPLETFLAYPKVGDILSINMIIQLDSALGGSESLLRNVTFGMNMGDDEIGFRLRVFRQKEGTSTVSSMLASSDMMMIGGVVVLIIILGGVTWFIIRRRPSIPVDNIPSMPSTDGIVVESPVIVSSLIIPQDTIAPITTISSLPVDSTPSITTPIVQNTVPTPIEIPVVPVAQPVVSSTIETTSLPQQKSSETN